jgi:hypothetical protein
VTRPPTLSGTMAYAHIQSLTCAKSAISNAYMPTGAALDTLQYLRMRLQTSHCMQDRKKAQLIIIAQRSRLANVRHFRHLCFTLGNGPTLFGGSLECWRSSTFHGAASVRVRRGSTRQAPVRKRCWAPGPNVTLAQTHWPGSTTEACPTVSCYSTPTLAAALQSGVGSNSCAGSSAITLAALETGDGGREESQCDGSTQVPACPSALGLVALDPRVLAAGL